MIKTLLKIRLRFTLIILILVPLLAQANFHTPLPQPADTEAPTAPTNLKATEITGSSITLSWTASTDNVGVVSYEIYQGVNILMGNSTTTTFVVTPLVSNYVYFFKIKAKDAAGNISIASISLSTKTLDITPPTRPAKLTASGATASTINLSWTASTDNEAVVAYDIYQGGNLLIATSANTNFTIAGLMPDNYYTFAVRARDAAGNVSEKSVPLLCETLDTQPPTAPTGIIAAEVTQTTVNLFWSSSIDNRGVSSYEIYKDGYIIGTSKTSSFSVANLTANTNYSFSVKALDAAGNTSLENNAVSITTKAKVPDYCVSTGFSSVLGIYINRVQIGSIDTKQTQPQTSTELKKGETYAITITPNEYFSGSTQFGQRYAVWIDYNGDLDFYDDGELVWNHEVTTLSPVIGTFVVPETAGNGPTRIRITTQGDGVGIPYPCGDYTGTYNYGETEDYTVNIVNSAKDPNASIAPSNLKASEISWATTNLSWSAPANTPGIIGYEIYQESVLIGSSETTSFSVAGLMQITGYNFTVKAKKADGTLSTASSPLLVTTIRAPKPGAPTNLAVSGITASKIDLSWTPSQNVSGQDITYSVYLTYYPVNNSFAGKTKDPYISLKNLISDTNYSITVKAVDEMGNEAISGSISAITLSRIPGPLPPTDLIASEITTSSLTLTWTASKNDPSVAYYDIYNGSDKIGTVNNGTTTFKVNGLKDDSQYSFTVRAFLEDSYASDASAISVKTVSLPKYCVPELSKVKRDYIADLDFGSLTRSYSSYSGYTDATIYTASLTPGQESTIIMSIDRSVYNTPKSESSGLAIWIDLNGDKDFDDEGELVWSALYQNPSSSDFTAVANFTLPTTVMTGKTRMRITMKENGIPTSCEKFAYGEIKDFTVDIKKPIAEFEAPTKPTNLSASNTTVSSTELSWTPSTDNMGVKAYDIYEDNTLVGTTDLTTFTVTGLNTKTTYSFTIKAKDYAQNISEISNALSVTTSATLSVEDYNASNKKDYILHPNPTSEKLFIRLPGDKKTTFKLSNLTGQNVGQGNVDELGIDVSQLSSGVYLIELNDGEKSVSKKFIKN